MRQLLTQLLVAIKNHQKRSQNQNDMQCRLDPGANVAGWFLLRFISEFYIYHKNQMINQAVEFVFALVGIVNFKMHLMRKDQDSRLFSTSWLYESRNPNV
mmetsp:Transcript_19370/g.40858  ORF Transcript_19370/g.40858 Transcript_19370/m.40858 type:complete len:100 (+) Transcript_19370:442-741(+)